MDIWNSIQFSQMKEHATYKIFDLVELCRDDPSAIQKMLKGLVKDLEVGIIRPLPHQLFPIQKTNDAFRFMAKAKHVGKIIITRQPIQLDNPNELTFNARDRQGTFLITGGFGGIGLEIVKWLVMEKGVRNLVVVGRSGGSVESIFSNVKASKKRLKEKVNILCIKGDISVEEEAKRIFSEIHEWIKGKSSYLCGIFHCAGIVDDGLLMNLEWKSFMKVFGPKVKGTWNLHYLSKDIPLNYFVLFSSITSMLGNVGQGNYVAANAFLDAIAYHRQSQGLCGLTINWGPWSEVGMASRMTPSNRHRMEQSMKMISTKEALSILDSILGAAYVNQYSPLNKYCTVQLGIFDINWTNFFSTSLQRVPSFISHYLQQKSVQTSQPRKPKRVLTRARSRSNLETLRRDAPQHFASSSLLDELQRVKPRERKNSLVVNIKGHLNKILGLNETKVDTHQPLTEMGMDSLMAIELRNAIANSIGNFGATLPSTFVFDFPSIDTMAEHLLKDVLSFQQSTNLQTAHQPEPTVSKIKHDLSSRKKEQIAIIGIGCRFPAPPTFQDGEGIEKFWGILRNGIDIIEEVPKQRWSVDEYYHPDADIPGKMSTRFGGFLTDVDKFDASFFWNFTQRSCEYGSSAKDTARGHLASIRKCFDCASKVV